MGRIFDALQRSEAERQDSDVTEIPTSIAEVLQSAERGLQDALQRSEAKRQAKDVAETPALGADLSRSAKRVQELGLIQRLSSSASPDSGLVVLTDPGSLGAEKVRVLGVRLRQLKQSRKLGKVLITSTCPEEGKSLISANLACMLARSRLYRTILVEGDLRRPTLTQKLGVGQQHGLAECLQSNLALEDVIYLVEPPGLYFLPAGSPPESPLELLQSGRLAGILDELSELFDWIIIDSPPVLPLADTSVWMRWADGVLMVAREGVTEKKQLQRALHKLDPSLLLGLVLNSSSNTDHRNYYQRYGTAAPVPRQNNPGSN